MTRQHKSYCATERERQREREKELLTRRRQSRNCSIMELSSGTKGEYREEVVL
jgi:hypothetical protein